MVAFLSVEFAGAVERRLVSPDLRLTHRYNVRVLVLHMPARHNGKKKEKNTRA